MPTRPTHPEPSRLRSGVTLAELLLVLTIFGVLLGIAAPRLTAALDREAVRGATDSLVSGMARARMLALAGGGADLVLQPASASYWIEAAAVGFHAPPVDLRRTFGVSLKVDGAAAPTVRIAYDALGIGRLANRTIRITRGPAAERITVSAYGRVRRW